MTKPYYIMIKKLFLFSVFSCLMLLSSCGYSRDGIIEEISKCEKAEDLKELLKEFDNPDLAEWLKEQPGTDVLKMANAASAKTRSLWIVEGPSAKEILSSDD